tara:strand:+ start:2047 stop:2310 length:264 start_codon:yes stop_codon:yes gene_type:complete
MKITSPIQKRLIKHFLSGTPLSIKNIWLIKCSNCSREIRRNFEIPFGVELNRKTITWKDEYSDGYYFEYSLKNSDYKKIKDLMLLFD